MLEVQGCAIKLTSFPFALNWYDASRRCSVINNAQYIFMKIFTSLNMYVYTWVVVRIRARSPRARCNYGMDR